MANDHQLSLLLSALDDAAQGDTTRRHRLLASLTRMLTHRGVTPDEAAQFARVLHETPEDTAGRCRFLVPPHTKTA